MAKVVPGPSIQEVEDYPGEDIESVSLLRTHFEIPKDELIALDEGVMWLRWFGKETASTLKPPILLCVGGTGCGMLYKAFAIKLQILYGGPVIIWDRFNMGLSDRVMHKRNGVALWTRQILQLLDNLHLTHVHLLGFSIAGTLLAYFGSRHPSRVSRMAMVSAQLGGAGSKTRKTIRKVFYLQKGSTLCCCMARTFREYSARTKIIKKVWRRCKGQVEEGADPDGLPVCKAMYRVKGTAIKLLEQFVCPVIQRVSQKGGERMCMRLGETGIPVYARNYTMDGAEVDLEGFARVWAKLKSMHVEDDRHIYQTAPGIHHAFYTDSCAEDVAAFFNSEAGGPSASGAARLAPLLSPLQGEGVGGR
jgi:pimeloyl-ACP methyl ester carboxylesterase